jgi:steroid delta-isomerase-like uncharacterized protein
MPERTSTTIQAYLDALVARGDFAAHLADDVTVEMAGTPAVRGRDAVRDQIVWLHTVAFDATVKVKTVITDEDHAVLEADFIGTHIGEFHGIAATGKSVNVPYCVVYDLYADKIAAIRIYMSSELFVRQLASEA